MSTAARGPEETSGSASPPGVSHREVELLERELAACRAEINALHDLLEDLPGIFETKFRQRLQPLLDQRDQLISDNQALRQQVLAAQPPAPPPLAPAPEAAEPPEPLAAPLGLRQRLRRLLSRADGPPTAGWADPTHR